MAARRRSDGVGSSLRPVRPARAARLVRCVRMAGERDVTPEQVEALRRDEAAQVVDVREDHEWDAGRIEGARHIVLGRGGGAGAHDRPGTRPVVFYCRVGGRSAMAADAFRRAGYEAYSFDGGLEAWAGDGRPLEPEDGSVGEPLDAPARGAADRRRGPRGTGDRGRPRPRSFPSAAAGPRHPSGRPAARHIAAVRRRACRSGQGRGSTASCSPTPFAGPLRSGRHQRRARAALDRLPARLRGLRARLRLLRATRRRAPVRELRRSPPTRTAPTAASGSSGGGRSRGRQQPQRRHDRLRARRAAVDGHGRRRRKATTSSGTRRTSAVSSARCCGSTRAPVGSSSYTGAARQPVRHRGLLVQGCATRSGSPLTAGQATC